MSIYTPVMPSVGASLGAGADSVKLTLTTYMLGFAVGQLFYGPLSDRFGRRPVLLGGLIFFTAATFACSFAPSIGGLIGLRIVQGLAAASGSVIGRAMTRDAYTFQEMPLVMSWISLGQNIAPSLAPTLGGFLGEWAKLARDLLVRRRLRHAVAGDHAVRPPGDQQAPQRSPRISAACCAARARCCATGSSSATC